MCRSRVGRQVERKERKAKKKEALDEGIWQFSVEFVLATRMMIFEKGVKRVKAGKFPPCNPVGTLPCIRHRSPLLGRGFDMAPAQMSEYMIIPGLSCSHTAQAHAALVP